MITAFHVRNLDTSQPSSSRDLAPPLLRLAQARLNFGSCLLKSAHPSHQTSSTFNEGPEPPPPPFPSQGSQICSHCAVTTCASHNSFPDSYPARLHANAHMQGHFLASYFRVFDVVLCDLPGASYYINGCLPLAFTFLSHLLTHPRTHPFTFFSSSSHLSLQSLPSLKQALLFPFLLQISKSTLARHEHRAGKRMLERTESR